MAKGTINKVLLIGRLGMNPEIRSMPNGIPVATLQIATNEGYKDKNTSQIVETTEWHKVSIYGQKAENIHRSGKKGDLVYIEGKIKTKKWVDKNGQNRFTTEINANNAEVILNNKKPHVNQDQNPSKNLEISNEFEDDIPF